VAYLAAPDRSVRHKIMAGTIFKRPKYDGYTILIVLIVIGLLGSIALLSRPYWIGSYWIYKITDSNDRNGLNIVPENHELHAVMNNDCNEYHAFGYKFCLPWTDIKEESTSENVSHLITKKTIGIIIENPIKAVDVRHLAIETFNREKVLKPGGMDSKHEFQLTIEDALKLSIYDFFNQTLYANFENYKFFTPYKHVYSQLFSYVAKIRLCKGGESRYCRKILSFNSGWRKGFIILHEMPKNKNATFYDIHFFLDDSDYLGIKIFGKDNVLIQKDIDLFISSIVKQKQCNTAEQSLPHRTRRALALRASEAHVMPLNFEKKWQKVQT
jgi:hypothetical protein